MQRRRYAQRVREAVDCTGGRAVVPTELGAATGLVKLKNKILHFTLYATDGYMNLDSGAWPPENDNTTIAGWGPLFNGPADAPANNPEDVPVTGPVYVWGFTDIDPEIDSREVPPGNHAPTGAVRPTRVGNAKVPAPYLECMHMDHVFITVINRGMYLFEHKPDAMQDDHSLHLHGIHAQTPYDGFPESAGSYTEQLRYFWEEPWYLGLGNGITPKSRDDAWNAMTLTQQLAKLNAVPDAQKVIRENKLNPRGGIPNYLNHMEEPPYGVGDGSMHFLDDPLRTQLAQFTYYFTPPHHGTFMYHCHVAASEHVQMGMYGALVVRPMDYKMANKSTWSVYGKGTNTNYDVEYTVILSEFDARWHLQIESDGALFPDYYVANWRPDIWMANGRTFPTTLLPFKWNAPSTLPPGTFASDYVESRYNTYLKNGANKRMLIRYIQMGYQEHPMHQHGWMMRVVGKDAMPKIPQQEVFTLLIGSGETYETITLSNPAYGITSPAGSPLSSPTTPTPGTLNWRILYPIHDHDDYRVTTNGFYPGGAVLIIETCPPPVGVPASTPTWDNVYANVGNGEVQPVPPGCP